jgi:hypothetical protein
MVLLPGHYAPLDLSLEEGHKTENDSQNTFQGMSFPAMSYFHFSFEIFDNNFLDRSVVIEGHLPIHGNQDHPDFVKYNSLGEPYLELKDDGSYKGSSTAPTLAVRRKYHGDPF